MGLIYFKPKGTPATKQGSVHRIRILSSELRMSVRLAFGILSPSVSLMYI